MLITQQDVKFAPITITLETRQEADALWAIINNQKPETNQQTKDDLALRNKLSNWFSNHCHW